MSDDDWDSIFKTSVYYQGRLWDAPFLDGALPASLDGTCDWCTEEIGPSDDAVQQKHMLSHLECLLCASMGGVAHLERRCSCFTGVRSGDHDDDPYYSFRDEARATLRWLLEHNQGRFKHT